MRFFSNFEKLVDAGCEVWTPSELKHLQKHRRVWVAGKPRGLCRLLYAFFLLVKKPWRNDLVLQGSFSCNLVCSGAFAASTLLSREHMVNICGSRQEQFLLAGEVEEGTNLWICFRGQRIASITKCLGRSNQVLLPLSSIPLRLTCSFCSQSEQHSKRDKSRNSYWNLQLQIGCHPSQFAGRKAKGKRKRPEAHIIYFYDFLSQTPWFAQRPTTGSVTWGFVATLRVWSRFCA